MLRHEQQSATAMDADERAALKAAYPDCYFARVLKNGCEAILAIPKRQPTPEREARAELMHGATVRLHG